MKKEVLSQIELIEFVAKCDIGAYKAPQSKAKNWFWRKAPRMHRLGLCGMILSVEAFVAGCIYNNSVCGVGGTVSIFVTSISTMNFWLGIDGWAPTNEELVASLSDSAWHYLKEHSKYIAELGARVRSFNDRLTAFKNAVLPLGDPIPDDYAAATDQLTRERSQLILETDDVLGELDELIAVDKDRLECLRESRRLSELEAVFAQNSPPPQYRDSRDITTLTAAITLRDAVEKQAEQLGLPPQWIPPRKKLAAAG
jgi:hypothetical protein